MSELNDKNVITKEEKEVVNLPKAKDTSNIRHLSDKYDEIKKQLKEEKNKTLNSPTQEDYDALKEKVKGLTDTNIEQTYGKDNVEEARTLLDAGFKPERVAEMLDITKELNLEPLNRDKELGLTPGNPIKPKELTEEELEQDRMDKLDALEKENAKQY